MKRVLYPTPPFVDHFAYAVLLDACSVPFLRFTCPEVLYTFVLKNVINAGVVDGMGHRTRYDE